jgi:hypothetical protein
VAGSPHKHPAITRHHHSLPFTPATRLTNTLFPLKQIPESLLANHSSQSKILGDFPWSEQINKTPRERRSPKLNPTASAAQSPSRNRWIAPISLLKDRGWLALPTHLAQ